LKIKIPFTLVLYHLVTVLLMPLLLLQAAWVRVNIIKLPEALGERCGCTGDGHSINLLITGDSATAGVGVEEQKDALSGQLTANLAAKYSVSWQLMASTGLTLAALIKKIETLPMQKFDYVLVSVGVNDVTHLTRENNWESNLNIMLGLLATKFDDPKILMTALPPMHLFTGIFQPLRWWLGVRAKRLNKLMLIAATDNNQCSVLTIDLPFTSKYLAKDGIHPSKLAYSVWADQVTKVLTR